MSCTLHAVGGRSQGRNVAAIRCVPAVDGSARLLARGRLSFTDAVEVLVAADE